MESFRANINPAMLRWARESMNLPGPSAASKLGVPEHILQAWEDGQLLPTFVQLRNIADKYRFPIATFYLDEPLDEPEAIIEFRSSIQDERIPLSYELLRELVRVNGQQEALSELHELDEVDRPEFGGDINATMSPEIAGERVRSWLGLRTDQQEDWARRGVLYGELRALVEAKGIMVAQAQGRYMSPIRGLALANHDFPAIVVSSTDSATGKVFTLMHELVHVLIRKGGSSEVAPVTANRRIGKGMLERFCNRVAAAALVPQEDLMRAPVVQAHRIGHPWQIGELREAGRAFGVSPQVMLIRLIGLEGAEWENYNALRRSFNESAPKQESRGGNPHRNKVAAFGRHYVRGVARAYESGKIGTLQALRYLNANLTSLPKIFEEAR